MARLDRAIHAFPIFRVSYYPNKLPAIRLFPVELKIRRQPATKGAQTPHQHEPSCPFKDIHYRKVSHAGGYCRDKSTSSLQDRKAVAAIHLGKLPEKLFQNALG
jgi:hypothetical protein